MLNFQESHIVSPHLAKNLRVYTMSRRRQYMRALYFKEFGDSSVLQYGEVPTPEIRQNEILVDREKNL